MAGVEVEEAGEDAIAGSAPGQGWALSIFGDPV